jgi:hypothetical protein
MTKGFLARLVALATVLVFESKADAQLPKRGTYSATYAWHFTGPIIEIEKDHVVWGGTETGAFRNDAGSGFFHAAIVVCTAAGEWKKGDVVKDGGDCVITDKDGDKAVMAFKYTGSGGGETQWTGGTGKYTGLKGRGTYQQTVAGMGIGWSVWKGEWELP